MTGGKFSQKRALAIVREGQALELRLAGATYVQIGERVGISFQAAYKIVVRALEKVAARNTEVAREVLVLELLRLDKMLLNIWALATSGKSLRAIDRVLKIMERRSKFLGLDAPTKTWVGDMGEAEILHDLANSVLDDPENQRIIDAIAARASKPGPGPITENPGV